MNGRAAALLAATLLLGVAAPASEDIVIGSKNFTEGIILGELLRQLTQNAGVPVRHQRGLGGTRLVFNALASGEIDAYVEYSGTLSAEIFAGRVAPETPALRTALAERGLVLAGALGFENNYALGVPQKLAKELGLQTISDLRRHPQLIVRPSAEFMDRADGWPGLQAHYGLAHTNVRGIEHEVAYRALAGGDAAVTDVYTTDAEIAWYELVTLEDDRDFFVPYQAVLVYRADLDKRAPRAAAALRQALGLIDTPAMRKLNAAVKLEGQTEAAAAARFLADTLGIEAATRRPTLAARVLKRTGEHLLLVAASLGAAVLVAVPLGIVASRRRRLGQLLLAAVGIGQTIPALALLVIMVPLFGIGAAPALVALFIYSLLPIVRNTTAGLNGVPAALRESAIVLGLPSTARLRQIELPLAIPAMLAGIKTAAVINVGGATLGALVGAGGYGQPILSGIRLDSTALILEGAVPAALLALLVQWLFEWAEKKITPAGIGVLTGNPSA